MQRVLAKVDGEGRQIEEPWTHEFQGAHIFILQEGQWILGNYMDTTLPKRTWHEWDYMPEELRAITGPIEDFVDKSCDPTG